MRVIDLLTQRQRYRQAIEAAALSAASDLSDIVINDPNFGFVSLTDCPAVGRATIARDGEPLPVHGINTLIGASRLDYIIGHELGDENLMQLALEDAKNAREAAVRLDQVLAQSLRPRKNNEPVPHDMDGNEVHPYDDAVRVFQNNLKAFTSAKPKAFSLTLGWLKKGTETITPAAVAWDNHPKKFEDCYTPVDAILDGCYRSYTDIPVGQKHFSFAGLGKNPSLVNPKLFVPADFRYASLTDLSFASEFLNLDSFIPEKSNEYLSTIVKAESVWQLPNLFEHKNDAPVVMKDEACAQPYAIDCQPAPSIFVMAFPNGRPSEINSIADVLSNRGLVNSSMTVTTPTKGDFPNEPQAYLRPVDPNRVVSQANIVFARVFHDWLQNNYALPQPDAILGALRQPLSSGSGQNGATGSIYIAEITSTGKVAISSLAVNPFADIRVNENQLYAINSSPAIIDGSNWTVVCRDQVYSCGTISGGQHAGQPMPGDPINWSQLKQYVSPEFSEAIASRTPSGITLSGSHLAGGGIPLLGSQLICDDGKSLPRNLRKSAYSGGLAVEVRISSPRAVNQ